MDPHREPQPPPPSTRRDLLKVGAGFAAAAPLAGCASRETAPDARAADRDAALDELFSELTDQRHTVEPISAEERAARRGRLGHLLREAGHDAWFCEGGATMDYLSGVGWGHSERTFGLIVLADGSHFWICPGFEAQKARLRVDAVGGDLVTWEEHEYAWAPLSAELNRRNVGRIAVDPGTRYFIPNRLGQALGPDRVVEGGDTLVRLRGVKDEHELALLRRANELTQQAQTAVSRHLRAGMSGSEVSAMMRKAQGKLGLQRVWVLALIGPSAAYPHGDGKPGRLERGDFLLVDTGGSFHGYSSDITRTWMVDGTPDSFQTRVWNTVRDAQRLAFDAIRPGVRCREVDRVARAHIEAAGFGSGYEALTHRLGHGIGMQGHEDPYFDGGSEVVLEPGMTLSDEPGIYLYGKLGVRLEDIIAVTPDGAEHFGDWQKAPDSPAS